MNIDGFLLVDKPAGWTSHDVVAKVRSILQQAQSQKLKAKSQTQQLSALDFQLSTRGQKVRVGHTGTLDPMATGLMILVLGSYTKKAGEFSKLDKTYEAEITLGATSTTGDSEGEISTCCDLQPHESQITEVIKEFIGEINQTPPAHSAIKIDGQRAYKLVRQGKPVKIEPRKITIYGINHITYDYPRLKFTVSVSSGTYIRSLASDIGEKLGTGAYLSNLRRFSVNTFNVKDAIGIENLDISRIQDNLQTGVAKAAPVC